MDRAPSTERGEKKPYEAPRLVQYGSVEELTGMQGTRPHRLEEEYGFPTEGRPFAS